MIIMKKVVYILVSVLLLSCSLNDDNNAPARDAKWSLIKISGGIEGIEINLEKGEITWVFDEVNNNIIVEVNIDDPLIGLSEGTYPYELETINNELFLFVDGSEFGALTISNTQLTIDQNITSTGNAADLFLFRFVR
jgi:hypothetical protein